MQDLLIRIICLLAVVVQVTSYPSGAPIGACSSMTPGHGSQPMTSPCPYLLTANVQCFQPGQRVLLSLQDPNGQTFRGLLVQARIDTANPQSFGRFDLNSNNDIQLLNCFDSESSAITHANPTDKRVKEFGWIAPTSFSSGGVNFTYTVVQMFTTYWVQQRFSLPLCQIQNITSILPMSSGTSFYTNTPINSTNFGITTFPPILNSTENVNQTYPTFAQSETNETTTLLMLSAFSGTDQFSSMQTDQLAQNVSVNTQMYNDSVSLTSLSPLNTSTISTISPPILNSTDNFNQTYPTFSSSGETNETTTLLMLSAFSGTDQFSSMQTDQLAQNVSVNTQVYNYSVSLTSFSPLSQDTSSTISTIFPPILNSTDNFNQTYPTFSSSSETKETTTLLMLSDFSGTNINQFNSTQTDQLSQNVSQVSTRLYNDSVSSTSPLSALSQITSTSTISTTTTPNGSCQDLDSQCLNLSPNKCYNHVIRNQCCSSCSRIESSNPPDCAYGDRISICGFFRYKAFCQYYGQECCLTCRINN